jgi:NAD(P)H-nitrite reductase large subunit
VSEPLVIVGHGMAAVRLADELTRCALARQNHYALQL